MKTLASCSTADSRHAMVVCACIFFSMLRLASADDVAYIQSEQIARLSIMPLNPTTSDVITFTAPLDGTIHGNECEMRVNLRGAPLISRDETNQTITLSTDGVFSPFCSRIFIPHSGAEGEFGPLDAGSWTFRDGFGNDVSFEVVADSVLSGDLDQSGMFDITDIDTLIANIASGSDDPAFDLNGDGAIDNLDRDVWLATAGAALLPSEGAFYNGDVNLDGTIDSTDLGRLLNNFNANADISWSGGDLDADGIVNSVDLGLVLNNFGTVASTSASAVPEPSSEFQLLIALLALLPVRYRFC